MIYITVTFIQTIQVYQVSTISPEETPKLPLERPGKLQQTRVHQSLELTYS